MCDVGTGSAEAAVFNPSRDPGGVSGINHLTASQGTLWAGQPGLGGSERLPGPGEGVAGRGAGPCLGLSTHSLTLGVPGPLRRVRATGPPPLMAGGPGQAAPLRSLSSLERVGRSHWIPRACACTHRLQHPDICYILQGAGLSLPASRSLVGYR